MKLSKEERARIWPNHCLRMAEATHALADLCDEADMIAAYLALASRWISLAAEPARPLPEELRDPESP